MREMLQATRADAVRPFSYFCTCWNVRPSASPSFSWLMPSIIRRMRTRLPTCLSIKLRGFFAILLSLRVSHLFRAACPSIRRPPVAVTRYEKRVTDATVAPSVTDWSRHSSVVPCPTREIAQTAPPFHHRSSQGEAGLRAPAPAFASVPVSPCLQPLGCPRHAWPPEV
jgi:hypothetical protein